MSENNKIAFFEKAPKIHNNYYDYSKVDFTGLTKEIIIICPVHGEFNQLARSHLKGYGCEKCGIEKIKITKIEKSKKIFFEEASKIHNNYYGYLKVDYKGVVEHVIITCPKHGDFQQMPRKHLIGQGCNKCGQERTSKIQTKSINVFIEECYKIHGKEHYDYKSIEYINDHTNIKIFCNIHNKYFEQTPSSHLLGCGCNDCGIEKRSKLKIELASLNFWQIANKDIKYDFTQFIYTKSREKSNCICKKCNNKFLISPNSYLSGSNCPFCINKTEQKLYKKINIKYPNLIQQYKVEWCKNKFCLPFDFCIQELNIIIELDGIQHFQKVKHFGKNIEQQRSRDLYKQKCANDNGYSIIRIYQEDVYYDTFDWFKKLYESIDKIINDKIIQNIYICKNNEYDNFENIIDNGNNNDINSNSNETFCKVCDTIVKYNFKNHENTQKHKDKLLNIIPNNDKKKYCDICNKYTTCIRSHYNSENHKNKISLEEWNQQIKQLDENTSSTI